MNLGKKLWNGTGTPSTHRTERKTYFAVFCRGGGGGLRCESWVKISIVRAWPRQQPRASAVRGTASRYTWQTRCQPGVWSKQRASAHHGVVAEGLVARVRRLIDVGPSRHLGRDGRRLSEREDAHSTSTTGVAGSADPRCRTNEWAVSAAGGTCTGPSNAGSK